MTFRTTPTQTGNQGGMGFHDGEVASMSSSLVNIDGYPAVNAE